jgi:phosphatidylserine/phosphatidylglycerophosphate/cardiolipin synthase-like enzyme
VRVEIKARYVLTDRAVIEALRQAAARGVNVRIWRDPGMAVRVGEADVRAQLAGRLQGIEIRPNPPGDELMHLKGYCVDRRLLRTGSASLSPSGETREDNDLVALRGVSVFDLATGDADGLSYAGPDGRHGRCSSLNGKGE